MFSPIDSLRERLQKESDKLCGFPIFDVRWDGDRGCLCIYEKDRRGNESVRQELRYDPVNPDKKKTFEYECEVPNVENGEVTGVTVEHRVVDIPLEPEDEEYEECVLGLPRQITESDVNEALDAVRYRVKRSEEVMAKLKKQKEDIAYEKFRIREDYTREAAKEMAKQFQKLKTGANPFVDYGHHSEAGTGSTEGFTVNDKRRIK